MEARELKAGDRFYFVSGHVSVGRVFTALHVITTQGERTTAFGVKDSKDITTIRTASAVFNIDATLPVALAH